MNFGVALAFSTTAIIGFILFIVSIATVSWVIVIEQDSNSVNQTRRNIGLFTSCTEGLICSNIENDLHIAAQVMSLISTVAHLAATICHFIKECHKATPHLVKIIATLFSLSAGAMLIAMGIFTKIYHPLPDTDSFGFSYILGWISFIASFILAILAVVQAVREAETVKAAYKKGSSAEKEENL